MNIVYYFVILIYILYFIKFLVLFNRTNIVTADEINYYIDLWNIVFKLLVGALLIYNYYFSTNLQSTRSLLLTAGILLMTNTIESIFFVSKSSYSILK